jgi:hypothetical protein
MKAIVLVLCVGVLMSSTGCNRSTDDPTAKRVAALEAKVATLEKRNSDLEFKGRMVSSHLFGSPLEKFFGADEFWENPYDSGAADCAKRCTETLLSENKVCEKIADCAQKQQCFKEASERASNCQTQCSQNNQPPIP